MFQSRWWCRWWGWAWIKPEQMEHRQGLEVCCLLLTGAAWLISFLMHWLCYLEEAPIFVFWSTCWVNKSQLKIHLFSIISEVVCPSPSVCGCGWVSAHVCVHKVCVGEFSEWFEWSYLVWQSKKFFLIPVNFKCRVSYSVHTAPMCNCMHQHLCTR